MGYFFAAFMIYVFHYFRLNVRAWVCQTCKTSLDRRQQSENTSCLFANLCQFEANLVWNVSQLHNASHKLGTLMVQGHIAPRACSKCASGVVCIQITVELCLKYSFRLFMVKDNMV